jgi:hypothetical protein
MQALVRLLAVIVGGSALDWAATLQGLESQACALAVKGL